jgi:uncharacterized membrane protein
MAMAGCEVTINRAVEDVFAILSNAENDPRYSSLVVEAHRTSPGPIGVGTTARLVSRMFGRRIVNDWTVTEFDPNRAYAWQRTSGGVPLGGRMTFDEADGRTRVSATITVEPDGILRLIAPLIATVGRRGFKKDLANLKQLMETHVL